MRLADLGRRFGNWLGIEPDDPDTVLNETRSCPVATRATSPSPDFDNAITELRGLIFDLRSGLDQHREA
jgi:hypothetical protein